MAVVIETTLGDITVDLFLDERPRACLNFLKLCKIKYYNYNLFHTISRGFMAQTGDPTGSRSGGESIFGVLDGPLKRYFEAENKPRIKHTRMGLISFVGNEDNMVGSQFFLTLGEDLTYLDDKHCVFGEVVEGFDILEIINEVICDTDDRPYQDVRITHTVILDDPYPDPSRIKIPSRSPSPSAERLQGGRIAPDEEIDETVGKSAKEVEEMQAEREAKARATILEMVGDIPDADMAPPENVLFVCKLNPVTTDDDLEIIFSRFGKIKSCEVIRDRKTGDSLQYAFIEFEERKSCEDAYFKMDNVLIDDRRIHVDFSQSVSKVKWHGKGRGVTHYDEKGKKKSDTNNDIGKGNYKTKNRNGNNFGFSKRRSRTPVPRKQSASPERKSASVRRKSLPDKNRRSRSRETRNRSPKEYRRQTPRRRSVTPKYRNRSRSPKKQGKRYEDKSSYYRDRHIYKDKDRLLKRDSQKQRESNRSPEVKKYAVEKGKRGSSRSNEKVNAKIKNRDSSVSDSSSSDSDKRSKRKKNKKKRRSSSSSDSSEERKQKRKKKRKKDSSDSSDSEDDNIKKKMKKKKSKKKKREQTSSESS